MEPKITLMTPGQKHAIRRSFPTVAALAKPISMLFYGRLFQVDPQLRPMFKQDIEVQGRKLMDMLAALMSQLDSFEDVLPALKALGQRHVGYGVRAEHYPLVGTSLLWAISVTLDEDFYPELREAWSALIEIVARVMMEGAAELPPVE
ncbi:MAG TPA: globin domain-containing protein [Bryobacteraceae bacterium]|nr:globin domain-containing protein [Bryobacteraceae bacterium]